MQKEQIFRGPELIVSMSSETLMYKVQADRIFSDTPN